MTQNTITQVDTTVNRPPAPSTLQKKAAFISQGGTTTSAGTSTLITQMSDLTAILSGAKAISAASWSGGVALFTTATANGFVTGEQVVVAGMTPAAWNGTYVATVSDSTHFTVSIVSNPSAATVLGSAADEDVQELVAMFTTFFAQGKNASAYVLELGHGVPSAGVSALTTYLSDSPLNYYVYTAPRAWSDESTFVTLCANNASNTSKTEFLVTSNLGNYTNFLVKSVYQMIESPIAPVTEFTVAFRAYWIVSQNPSSTNQVPNSAYSYAIGVTPYPITNAQKTLFQEANLNYIGTGAEGGLTSNIDFYGSVANGDPLNMWYSIDWVQIEVQRYVSNAVVSGSNRQPPLLYNQNGINFLQNVAGKRMGNAVSYGLVFGDVVLTKLPQAQFIENLNNDMYRGKAVINAEPVLIYTKENPSDYSIGKYGGLTAAFIPQLGFKHIVFGLNVNLFV